MLWNFNLFYHSSSIQEMKHVLRPKSRFLKLEACNNCLNHKRTFVHQTLTTL